MLITFILSVISIPANRVVMRRFDLTIHKTLVKSIPGEIHAKWNYVILRCFGNGNTVKKRRKVPCFNGVIFQY
jgi:hypothetical protein